ncbi:hypothetical protein [Blastococcus xanthinilyticus]|uniref:Uncharacterized protein n=1 Tax=Blastococcus xanthinilyticus TaxID=1564164 RepID=A0A5S5CVH5_9ACTN|nr:hypothetical protein [Blastococcus xanthinilyticus]TYP87094.1 hypothetical protein BD833_10729 [Blastococcus xanthinilyticus]
MTSDEPDPQLPAQLTPEQDRPGPDRYTLLAWVELELALEAGVRVDAAHAVLGDAVVRAFGPGMFGWVAEALAAEGRDPRDLAVLLDDDALAGRVLAALHERMGADDEAPEPPDARLVWSAFSPDDPYGGRGAIRRAAHRRGESARRALLLPRRPRVAGRRER